MPGLQHRHDESRPSVYRNDDKERAFLRPIDEPRKVPDVFFGGYDIRIQPVEAHSIPQSVHTGYEFFIGHLDLHAISFHIPRYVNKPA